MQGRLTVRRWRDKVLEAEYPGVAAVVNARGDLVAACGDPEVVVPLLACAHPFQLVALTGAEHKPLVLPEAALAVAAGCNAGDGEQLAAVLEALTRAGLGQEHLQCGPRGAQHPCAGFHAALLLAARQGSEPTAGYRTAAARADAVMTDGVLRMARKLRTEVPYVTDDCGVVSPCLPLPVVARLYAYLADASPLPPALAGAVAGLGAALRTSPGAFAAPGSFEHDLLQASDGDLLVRVAENGLAAATVRGRGWGLALKTAAGDPNVARVALLALLERLKADPGGRAAALLDSLTWVRNGVGERCARWEAQVELAARRR